MRKHTPHSARGASTCARHTHAHTAALPRQKARQIRARKPQEADPPAPTAHRPPPRRWLACPQELGGCGKTAAEQLDFAKNWAAFLGALVAATKAVSPAWSVQLDVCGCGGEFPLDGNRPDYMGLHPQQLLATGVEPMTMCTYSSNYSQEFTNNSVTYNTTADRLGCIGETYV